MEPPISNSMEESNMVASESDVFPLLSFIAFMGTALEGNFAFNNSLFAIGLFDNDGTPET